MPILTKTTIHFEGHMENQILIEEETFYLEIILVV